jgi:hypothetical protein
MGSPVIRSRCHCTKAIYTFEGTDTVQALIVGRAITGLSAFV